MEKIPTAKEFINKKIDGKVFFDYEVPDILIEFAKLHVDAALEEASEKVGLSYKQSILNSYPLDNIK